MNKWNELNEWMRRPEDVEWKDLRGLGPILLDRNEEEEDDDVQ